MIGIEDMLDIEAGIDLMEIINMVMIYSILRLLYQCIYVMILGGPKLRVSEYLCLEGLEKASLSQYFIRISVFLIFWTSFLGLPVFIYWINITLL